MATKGERTRQRVVELAAPVFNQRGYWGASLSDVMSATGLEKGGIYNHFSSKEELAVAAFEHNTEIMSQLIRDALAGRSNAVDRLVAIIGAFREFAENPPFPGGCPMLNTAVEADDSQPRLRERAREVLSGLRDDTVARIVRLGIERGEIAADADPDEVASVLVAGAEEALMLTQLYGDPVHMQRTAAHLETYARSLARRRKR